MQYVSELLGAPVCDPEGRVVAKVSDVLVAADADYPAVDAVALKPRNGEPRTVPWSALSLEDNGDVRLSTSLADVVPFEPPAHELSLARQVLDHQIIDVNGVRVVRVNDLQLAQTDGSYRLVGVDISTAALLRRMGAARLLGALGVKLTPTAIAWASVEPVESGGAGVKLKMSHEDLAKLHPSDIAQIISQLDQHHVHEVLETLDDEAAADTIGEVSPDLQVALLQGMEPERAADILEEMDPDDAADILGDMEPERAHDLLSRMEPDEADDVRELLTYEDESAGGLMTNEVVTVPASVTAEQAMNIVRQQAAEMENVYSVYVVDDNEVLLGELSLRELIVADPSAPIGRVMHRELIRGRLDDSQEEVARLIAKYNLLALPIVNDVGQLKGIVTVDDAMDVILPDDWKARIPRVYAKA
ncbi:MAG: magnesium transporter [Chloroflexi bacterium]|nr:magnesium transporter [Chloroflexota bacterium]MBV9133564.1 magnesium transporter [Chloroflexota bacterium]MBV9898732.1 magnesium transporter [Chloroflexota bacterium]